MLLMLCKNWVFHWRFFLSTKPNELIVITVDERKKKLQSDPSEAIRFDGEMNMTKRYVSNFL